MTILIFAFFLYSMAMPISRIFFDTFEEQLDIQYMIAINLGSLGYMLASWFTKKDYEKYIINAKINATYFRFSNESIFILMSLFFISLFFIRMLYSAQFNIFNFFAFYGFEATYGTEHPLLTLLGGSVAISGLITVFACCHNSRKNAFYITILCILFFAILISTRGHRLWGMYIVIPCIIIYFQNKSIKPWLPVLFAILAFLFMQFIGVARGYGLNDIQKGDISFERFDPLEGEFGTSYSVFTVSNRVGFFEDKQWGKSYTIDGFLVCIPSFIWPSRPDGLAIKLALTAHGTSRTEDLTHAFGFNSLSEAIVNFGIIGPLPVLFFTYLIFIKLSIFLTSKIKLWSYVGSGLLGSIAFLMNRYDFTMIVKSFIFHMIPVMICSAIILALCKLKNKNSTL